MILKANKLQSLRSSRLYFTNNVFYNIDRQEKYDYSSAFGLWPHN